MDKGEIGIKLSFEEQIKCLKDKGVLFDIIKEEQAKQILHDLNYYYKLTVYKRNFTKDKSGKRRDLEFAYLVDISRIDMRLRYILLNFTLDIEHALKTYIIAEITENDATDGYDIVESFFSIHERFSQEFKQSS